jgi:hypothetical protein
MKKAIVLLMLAAGTLMYADLVFAHGSGGSGGGSGSGSGGSGGGAGGGAGAGGGGGAGAGASGGDGETTALGDGTGTGLGLSTGVYINPIAGWSNKPEDFEALSARGYAPGYAPYGTYPAAMPGVVVAPAPGVVVVTPGVVVPMGPLMCPNINASDPRKC